MEEVERRVSAWMRQRHPDFPDLTPYLKDCIAQRRGDEAVFKDLDEALSELERIQSGML